MSATRIIRPRPGDLERATHPHVPVPSGQRLGTGIEICDLCGLSWGSPMHLAAKEFIGPREVSRLMGIHENTARLWMRNGRFNPLTVWLMPRGNYRRVHVEEVARVMKERS